MNWTTTVPEQPGVYWWRRSPQWEEVPRALPASKLLYSHRYCQTVPAEKIGGQWGDRIGDLP